MFSVDGDALIFHFVTLLQANASPNIVPCGKWFSHPRVRHGAGKAPTAQECIQLVVRTLGTHLGMPTYYNTLLSRTDVGKSY